MAKIREQDMFEQFNFPMKPKDQTKKKIKAMTEEEKGTDLKAVLIILKTILTLCGLGATAMSSYYSYAWFIDRLNNPFAFIATGIFILFMVACFEVAGILIKYGYVFLGVTFYILWFCFVLFSMTTTIGGQYNRLIEDNRTMRESRKKDSGIMWNYLQMNKDLDKLISDKTERDKQISDYTKTLNELDKIQSTMSFEEYEDRRIKISNDKNWSERKSAGFDDSIQKKRDEIKGYVSSHEGYDFSGTEEQDPPDFYLWLSNVFRGKVRVEDIQFWTSAIPALFYDIVSPLSFYVVFFVNGRRKKKEKKVIEDFLTKAEKETEKSIKAFDLKRLLQRKAEIEIPIARVQDGILRMNIKRIFGFMVKSSFEIK